MARRPKLVRKSEAVYPNTTQLDRSTQIVQCGMNIGDPPASCTRVADVDCLRQLGVSAPPR